jgi:hypothetical protein
MTIQDLREEVYKAMKDKPKEWRNGQFVFNYIDEVYDVARDVTFMYGIDCYYDDDKIYPFLVRSWQVIERRSGELKGAKMPF